MTTFGNVPADMTPHAAAVQLGARVREAMGENGGDRHKAAEVVWFSMPQQWRDLFAVWALTQAEYLAYRVDRPVADRGSTVAWVCDQASSVGDGTNINDAGGEEARRMLRPTKSLPPTPSRRASFFKRDGAELDYMVVIPTVGRKRLGDTTATDWAKKARYYGNVADTYKTNAATAKALAKRCGAGTLGDVWGDLSDKEKAWLRAEVGASA